MFVIKSYMSLSLPKSCGLVNLDRMCYDSCFLSRIKSQSVFELLGIGRMTKTFRQENTSK